MSGPRSYILRVYRKRVRIAGVVEDLRSGERHAFASPEDLWEWLRRPLASSRQEQRGSQMPPGTKA